MVGFEKALGAVKMIKDHIQYRSQSLFNLARDYFSKKRLKTKIINKRNKQEINRKKTYLKK